METSRPPALSSAGICSDLRPSCPRHHSNPGLEGTAPAPGHVVRQRQLCSFSLCFLYIFLTSLHPPRSLNTRYSVTVSAGQKSRHGLAGSSARGLKALHLQCRPGHTIICGPDWGRSFLAHSRRWQHPFLTGCRTEVPASLWQGLLQPLPPASSHMCDSGLSTWCSAVQESGGM